MTLSRIRKPESFLIAAPLALFAFLALFGTHLGLTDDEAYYWVLAQKPALGYAYHPPMVAWMIALAQKLGLEGILSVRLPAALSMSVVFALALRWIREAGVEMNSLRKSAWVVLAFGGFFALSWMMVPDVPLFLCWMIAFFHCWRVCSKEEAGKSAFFLLALAVCGGILSKFSAVLWVFSAGVACLLWAPRANKWRAIIAMAAGTIFAFIPILAWNATHEWGSLLYQLRDRHDEAHLSLIRYARFWGSQIAFVGLPLILYSFFSIPRGVKEQGLTPRRFALVWALPAAAVFLLQPSWSDFKPHWAFIVWWPMILLMAQERGGGPFRLARWQIVYGLSISTLILLSCLIPLLGPFGKDPRLDVTNDMVGWSELKPFLEAKLGPQIFSSPFVGSRYQTAAQTAFALRGTAQVTLFPRDAKSKDEWLDLDLTKTVYFVADNRYSAAPEFPGAKCMIVAELNAFRLKYPAKQIRVWRCEPGA